MRFGAHMSISGGVAKAFARGEQHGCDAMQIFCKNERQWVAKPYPEADIELFRAEQTRSGITPLIVHSTYLINLASPDDTNWEKSIAAFADELIRCDQLGIDHIVLHPGAHVGSGEAAGLRREAEAFRRLLSEGPGGKVRILLETTAGQGSALGSRFEHLAELLGALPYPDRLGVCVDTCHIFTAGYDIRTPETYAQTFDAFDRIVGLKQIYAFHLNDTNKELGSHVDRHTHIGQGLIGAEGFRLLVTDPRFQGLPAIIETPRDEGDAGIEHDRMNLALLRSLYEAGAAATVTGGTA